MFLNFDIFTLTLKNHRYYKTSYKYKPKLSKNFSSILILHLYLLIKPLQLLNQHNYNDQTHPTNKSTIKKKYTKWEFELKDLSFLVAIT